VEALWLRAAARHLPGAVRTVSRQRGDPLVPTLARGTAFRSFLRWLRTLA